MIKEFLKDNTEACLELIDSDQDLSIINPKTGDSLLQIVIQNQNPELLKALIKKNVDINYLNNKQKTTPFFTALQSNNIQIISLLLQSKKVDKDQLIDGLSYLCHSVVVNSIDIIELMIKYFTPIKQFSNGKALRLAITHDHCDSAMLLIQAGDNLELVDEEGDNIIHILSQNGNAEILNYIINYLVNKKDQTNKLQIFNQLNKDGNAPIHLAAINERDLIIQLFIKYADALQIELQKQNKANLTYLDIKENIRKKEEQEKQEKQERKKQNQEERVQRQQQRIQEVEDQKVRDKEEKQRIKQEQEMMEIKQKEQDTKSRLLMLVILAVVFIGFYVVLESTITKKEQQYL